QPETFLAAMALREREAGLVRRTRLAATVGEGAILDLDHFRTLIGQNATQLRTGDNHAEIEHAQAAQRAALRSAGESTVAVFSRRPLRENFFVVRAQYWRRCANACTHAIGF